jgi:hypothetical protein
MLHERRRAAQTNIRPPRSDTRINKCVGLIATTRATTGSRPRDRKAVRFRRIIIRSQNVIADLRRRVTRANKTPGESEISTSVDAFRRRIDLGDIG